MNWRWGICILLVLVLFGNRLPAQTGFVDRNTFEEIKAKAENGDAEAQSNLGYCYLTGNGVAQDYAESAKWYGKAAEQNHAEAQYSLCSCYGNGQGVTRDYVAAYKWCLLALAQGDEDARKAMTIFEKAMTKEQIAEGKKLAGEFKPK